ncbi:unnamed protein product [Somion occarium]|uniref:Fungal-type protein kinase domain-containing protein n=1 Tax=Somion occarium TaxID=3059160 RepID=A0ABP1EB47_9APHY
MHGTAIGPMPRKTFMDKYLPVDERFKLSLSKKFFKTALPDTPSRESEVYEPFVNLMNATAKICPGFTFCDTADKMDPNSTSKFRPDVGLYEGERPSPTLVFAALELFIEWKLEEVADGYNKKFKDTTVYIENGASVKAKATRGQLYSYASLLMSHQHRLFGFAVGVYGSIARLYRFDRSSVVVSEPIYYLENPLHLVEFFWRFARLSPTERGYDPSVSLASSEECVLFDRAVAAYLRRVKEENLRTLPGLEKMTDGDYMTSKVQVNNRDGATSYYIIRKPLTPPVIPTPCGRATRGYVAIRVPDTATGWDGLQVDLEFLKDSWRVDGYDSEADIYAELRNGHVSHLPTISCAGDVIVDGNVQRTTNQDLLEDQDARPWRRPTGVIRTHIHHRVVQGLLYPLSTVKSARELIRASQDALESVIEAYTKCNRLHRDVSNGNIMLKENFTDGREESGILNDWDHSRNDDAETLIHNYRTGTWQFMSILLLQDTEKRHNIFDDVESILWVILFVAVHYFTHEGKFSLEIFNQFETFSEGVTGQKAIGGHRKRAFLSQRNVKFHCRALHSFVIDLAKFHNHYHGLATEALESEGSQLADYETLLKNDLQQLLIRFKTILNDESADWSHGLAVEDIYPPQGKRELDQAIALNQEIQSGAGDWSGAGPALPTKKAKQKTKSRPKTKQSADAKGKGKGKDKALGRAPSSSVVAVASSSRSRSRGTKRPREDVESEDEDEAAGAQEDADVECERGLIRDASGRKRSSRLSLRKVTKKFKTMFN